MKKSLFTLALTLGLFSFSFASNGGNNGDSTATKSSEEAALTVDEQALLNQLEAELDVSLDDLLGEIAPVPVTKVVVYDLGGNIVQEQEGEIDLDQLPKDANLLMSEGSTQYFLVN